jgi:phosphatidylserine/phosphatidylglycerophosphate/cardiolipin synthase-like enzyme
MKRIVIPFLVILLFVSSPGIQAQEKATPCPSLAVYFCPKGGCTEAIIKELDKAKTSILVQAYSFTSAPIAKALLNAHKREVKVEVILDKSQERENTLQRISWPILESEP